MPVETLVVEPPLEALDEGVLDGLAWLDEAQLDASLVVSMMDRLACQLGSIVQHDLVGSTALGLPLPPRLLGQQVAEVVGRPRVTGSCALSPPQGSPPA